MSGRTTGVNCSIFSSTEAPHFCLNIFLQAISLYDYIPNVPYFVFLIELVFISLGGHVLDGGMFDTSSKGFFIERNIDVFSNLGND